MFPVCIGGGSYWAGPSHFYDLVGRPYTWPAHFLGDALEFGNTQKSVCGRGSASTLLWSNCTKMRFHLKTLQNMRYKISDLADMSIFPCCFL